MSSSAQATLRTTSSGPSSGTNLVISLDVGTTFSGASWALLKPGEKNPRIWDVDEFRRDTPPAKVPTVLYYDHEGKLRATGSETLDRHTVEDPDKDCTRVKWFKLLLRPDSLAHQLGNALHTEMPRNKKLVTVIADFLRYMVNLASKNFRETMDAEGRFWEEVKNRVIYILSYSNGWNTFQHSLMRDAAIQAEIIPNSDEGKHRIKFVSEAEASLHWCIKNRVGSRHLNVGSQLILVDAGGGTINISSFKSVSTEPLEFEESSIPECHLQGSAFMTQAFRRYVEAKLKGTSFGAHNTIDRIVENFEQQAMRTFKSRDEDIPVTFGRSKDTDSRFDIKAGQLFLRGEEMAQFFEPACKVIVASVKAKVVPKCKAIVVLVGGFSRNEYLFEEVQRRLKESVRDIQVLRPAPEGVKPSAHGVLCFYLNGAVRARMAKGTYGVSCIHDFDPGDPKHVQRRSRVQNNSVTGQQYLEGGFFATLKKGTVIQETELTRFPFWHSQSTRTPAALNIVLECYQGDVLDIKFRDEDGEDQFQELCSFNAVIPKASLLRMEAKVKSKGSEKYYYVSNFHIVVSFGATEFKCHIEWTDKRGKTQRGPITPIWTG